MLIASKIPFSKQCLLMGVLAEVRVCRDWSTMRASALTKHNECRIVFYRNRRKSLPLVQRRTGSLTTRAKAIVSLFGLMSIKTMRNSFCCPKILVFCYWSWLPDAGYKILASISCLPDAGYQILATGSWLPHLGHQIMATRFWLPHPSY